MTLRPIDDWDYYWRQRGACTKVDRELFFLSKGSTDQNKAMRACFTCRVRTECLAHALDERIAEGIFGGTTPHWRRELLLRRPQVKSWRSLLITARAEYLHRCHASPSPTEGPRTHGGPIPPEQHGGADPHERVAKSANAADLKSAARTGLVGSSPTSLTTSPSETMPPRTPPGAV